MKSYSEVDAIINSLIYSNDADKEKFCQLLFDYFRSDYNFEPDFSRGYACKEVDGFRIMFEVDFNGKRMSNIAIENFISRVRLTDCTHGVLLAAVGYNSNPRELLKELDPGDETKFLLMSIEDVLRESMHSKKSLLTNMPSIYCALNELNEFFNLCSFQTQH